MGASFLHPELKLFLKIIHDEYDQTKPQKAIDSAAGAAWNPYGNFISLPETNPAKMQRLSKNILFIHGACHGAWCWTGFMDFFRRKGFSCHALNLRGHERPGVIPKGINRHSLNDYLEDVMRKVDAMGTGDDVVLVGHSMGGMLIQKYLERRKCAGAVLMAPVPPTGMFRAGLRFLRNQPRGFAKMVCTLDLSQLANSPEKVRWAVFSDDMPDWEVRQHTAMFCGESVRAFVEMLHPGIREKYHSSVPMLVLGAENDRVFSVKEVEATARRYGAPVRIFPDMAHNMMLEKGSLSVAEFIHDWILRGGPLVV